MRDDWKQALERDGVARIMGVFSKEEMDRLRALSLRALRHADDHEIQWRGDFPALLFAPKGLNEYRQDPRLVSIVQEVLGHFVLQLNNQLYFRLPGDGDQFAWHQDISFRIPKDNFDRIEEGYLQTAIIIDDMTYENGAIEYVHGSHKAGDLGLVPRDGTERGLRSFEAGKFVGQKMCAKSGDVLVWSVMVVHGSEPNQSQFSRAYYMNGFAKASCVRGQEFPPYLVNGRLA